MNTTTQAQVRPIEIALVDFKGQTRRVPLAAPAVLLAGMNGRGKSTLLEALHLAFTGCLPGYRASQMDVPTLQGLAGPSGRWSIEASMTDGGLIHRSFLGIQTRVRFSAPGVGILPDRNDDHEAAILDRYGDWTVTLNLADLTAMVPDSLKAFVLDLCARAGGSAAWTQQQVCAELTRRVPALGTVEADAALDGPVAQVDALEEGLNAALTDCRRDIREANTRRRSEVPEPPNPVDMEASVADVARLEAALADAQLRRGALVADHDAALSRAKAAVADRESESKRLADEVRAAKTRVSAADSEVAAARAALSQLEAKSTALGKSTPETTPPAATAPKYEAALAALKAAAPANPIGEFDARIAGLDAAVTDAKAAFDAANAEATNCGAALHEARRRAERYASGKCPECGHSIKKLVEDLGAEIAGLESAYEAALAAKSEASAALARAEADRDTAKHAAVEAYRASAAHAQKVAAAERALADARLADEKAGGAYAKSLAEAEGHAALLASQVESARAALVAAEGRRAAASDAYADASAAATRAAEALVAACPDVPALDTAEVDAGIAQIRADLEDARARADVLRFADQRHRDAIAARDAAEAEHARCQETQAALKSGLEAIEEIRSEVIGAYVDPLVSRVNEFMSGYLGTFGARFAPRFALGFARADGVWVPLQRLSKGEFALAALSLAWALSELRRPPVRLLSMDDIEHLDTNNLPAFLGAVAVNATGSGEGGFDLVMLAGRGEAAEYRPLCEGLGIEVVDLDTVAAGSDAASAA